ncbi:hypothetical protein ACHAWF_013147 [Thalassiosira exigua]
MRRDAAAVTSALAAAAAVRDSSAYVVPPFSGRHRPLPRRSPRHGPRPLFSDPSPGGQGPSDDDMEYYDPNRWIGSDEQSNLGDASWEENLAAREDGSLWSSFAGTDDDAGAGSASPDGSGGGGPDSDGEGGEAWLDALASIAADEVEFMSKEADRADKVRQMQELGFEADSIASTLGVETDDARESYAEENEALEAFREVTAESGFGMVVEEDVDLQEVESHGRVDWDDEADEPVRAQHVYVDEVTCIGCTNCAMIAQSTFFMEGEHGRARVFQQWGDDEETIEIAIQTCPVDCIHYVPYNELKRLEIERRKQNINFKARLVSQSEGTAYQAKYGGGALFTDQQVISGNMGSRCNNCPSRGCKNCPMFGVGLNPEFQKREAKRKEKLARAEMKKKMESQNKRAEL